MPTPTRYGSPTAFRRALTDKLKAATTASRWSLPQLQRQMAYDRLLTRLYLVDDGWVVKGATALLARDIGVRATIDIDIYHRTSTPAAEAELRAAAAMNIGDWFRFEVGAARPVGLGEAGVRLPLSTYVGTTLWAAFHVDVVGPGVRMTAAPDDVPPLARVSLAGVQQRGYRAYPLVDHVADKVAAIFERHGPGGAVSTRYKDLVDLVAIVQAATIHAEAQLAALRSETVRRGLVLPDSFTVPDRARWQRGYGAEARRSLLSDVRTLDRAVEVVRPFLDPLLDGSAAGMWRPGQVCWASRAGGGAARRGGGGGLVDSADGWFGGG